VLLGDSNACFGCQACLKQCLKKAISISKVWRMQTADILEPHLISRIDLNPTMQAVHHTPPNLNPGNS
jgi:Fe-S-cluster-containing dehydrogenase component